MIPYVYDTKTQACIIDEFLASGIFVVEVERLTTIPENTGDDLHTGSDLGYEPGDYSPGPSSDECPLAYEERKEYLWHLNEEVQSWN